ncbi:MAG: haloacid dehalogenase-like hydrolase [Acidobacteriota bacterium]
MRIGIDFDNTIVCYDALFHKVARERDLVPGDLPVSKIAVRDFLRRTGREDTWTELQGYVYGARMTEAEPYPGAPDFLGWARQRGHDVFIIGHRSKRPFLGPPYDLHTAARRWVRERIGSLLGDEVCFFEPAREEKLERVAALGCDYFVDDLPEILWSERFPAGTRRVLFDPNGLHESDTRCPRFSSWPSIRSFLETP